MDALMTQLDEGLMGMIAKRNMKRLMPGAQAKVDKVWSSEPVKAAASAIPMPKSLKALTKASQGISGIRSKFRERFGTKKKSKPQATDQQLPGQGTA
jgi:hypothetical protein